MAEYGRGTDVKQAETCIVEVAECVDVENVDVHRREQHVRYETGEHMPGIKA